MAKGFNRLRRADAALQNQLAASQPVTRSSVESRGLGKPGTRDGSVGKWRDWKVVMRSYTEACHDKLGHLMTVAERTGDSQAYS